MIFSTPIFMYFFFPAVLLAYFGFRMVFAAAGTKASLSAGNMILLAASLIFYWWGETYLSVLMWLSIAFNYLIGLWIGRVGGKNGSNLPMIVGIVANLMFLVAFKYSNFFIVNINAFVGEFLPYFIFKPESPQPGAQQIIGISFFTFQAMTYLIDLNRGEVEVEKSPSVLALYISLFPQLVAGPIVRYQEIAQQLRERNWRDHDLAKGMERFTVGLVKKVVIADEVGKVSDTLYAMAGNGETLSSPLAWLAIICYALQIYFDFSGYSDMAIGLGRMFGFRFPENFMHPYKSTSITEFWRRWHMTLSRFFRDYLYIPLGGNRVGPARQYFNLWAVFLLCGLWHGASWAFVIWGAWQGVFLTIERMGLGKWLKNKRVIAHIYVTWAFLMGWVFFRSQSMDQAFTMFESAYLGGGWLNAVNEIGSVASNYQLFIVLVGCIMVYPVRRWLEAHAYLFSRRLRGTNVKLDNDGMPAPAAGGIPGVGVTVAFTVVRAAIYGLAAVYALSAMAANTNQAFIYFRF